MNVNDKNFIDHFINNMTANREEIDLTMKDNFTKLPIFSPVQHTKEPIKFAAANLNAAVENFESNEMEDAILKELEGTRKNQKSNTGNTYKTLVNELNADEKKLQAKKIIDERAHDVSVNKTILGASHKSLFQDILSKDEAERELTLMDEGSAYLHDDNGNETFMISIKVAGSIKHLSLNFENVKMMIEGLKETGALFIPAEDTSNLSLKDDAEYMHLLDKTLNSMGLNFKSKDVSTEAPVVQQEEVDPLDELLGDLSNTKLKLQEKKAALMNNPKFELEVDPELVEFREKLKNKFHKKTDLQNLKNTLAARREELAFQKFCDDLHVRGDFLSRMDRTQDARVKQNSKIFAKWKGQNNNKILEGKPYYHGRMRAADVELELISKSAGNIITYFDVEKKNVVYAYKSFNTQEIVHTPMGRAFKGFEIEDLANNFRKAGYTFVEVMKNAAKTKVDGAIYATPSGLASEIYRPKDAISNLISNAPKMVKASIQGKVVSTADVEIKKPRPSIDVPKADVNNYSYFSAFVNSIIKMVKFGLAVAPAIYKARTYIYSSASKAKSVWKRAFSV
jgi:hypothetical protein